MFSRRNERIIITFVEKKSYPLLCINERALCRFYGQFMKIKKPVVRSLFNNLMIAQKVYILLGRLNSCFSKVS